MLPRFHPAAAEYPDKVGCFDINYGFRMWPTGSDAGVRLGELDGAITIAVPIGAASAYGGRRVPGPRRQESEAQNRDPASDLANPSD